MTDQIQKSLSQYKAEIENSFQVNLQKIKAQYKERIKALKTTIKCKDEQIRTLEVKLTNFNSQVSALRSKDAQNLQKIQSYKEEIKQLKNGIEKTERSSKQQLDQQHKLVLSLSQEILEHKEQIEKFVKQQEVFSTDYSVMSKQQLSSFSFEISELFRNSPQQILRFLQSVPGQQSKDPKEEGDMTCMLVSKDGLSLQKFVKINRTFLKRAIKEHEKRFRFVLIHKPDKL